jgi:hypothetical protein
MQVAPAGVVNATSSTRGVLLPFRSATWKSAASTGPAPPTQASASATAAPGPGAAVVVVALALDSLGVDEAVRDGEIGVSLVGLGWLCRLWEQPAISVDVAIADAANMTAMRIKPG